MKSNKNEIYVQKLIALQNAIVSKEENQLYWAEGKGFWGWVGSFTDTKQNREDKVHNLKQEIAYLKDEYRESLKAYLNKLSFDIGSESAKQDKNFELKRALTIIATIFIIPALILMPIIGFKNYKNLMRGKEKSLGMEELKKNLSGLEEVNANFHHPVILGHATSGSMDAITSLVLSVILFIIFLPIMLILLPFVKFEGLDVLNNVDQKGREIPQDYTHAKVRESLKDLKQEHDKMVTGFIGSTVKNTGVATKILNNEPSIGKHTSLRLKYLVEPKSQIREIIGQNVIRQQNSR